MTKTMAKEAPQDLFTIERIFHAPREAVWKAWTDPALLAKWFGPKGCMAQVVRFELRPGGVWHSRMTMPDGTEMWGKFVFREVTPPSRLVWVHAFSDAQGGLTRHPLQPHWPLELTTTVTFEDHKDKTKLTLTWEPLNASEVERKTFVNSMAGMKQGWGGSFDQLDDYLSE